MLRSFGLIVYSFVVRPNLRTTARPSPTSTRLLGPTRVHVINGTPIGSAVFAGITVVTDLYSILHHAAVLRVDRVQLRRQAQPAYDSQTFAD